MAKREVGDLMTSADVVIDPGESLSSPVNVIGVLAGIAVPENFKPSVLTFQVSPDNGASWYDLMGSSNMEAVVNVTAGCLHAIAADSPLDNKTWLKIRTGSRNGPVIQPDGAVFKLLIE